MRRAPLVLSAVLVASLAVSACGSTVAQQSASGGGLQQQGTAQGLGAPGDGTAPVGAGDVGAIGGSVPGETGGGSGGQAGGIATGSGQGAGSSPAGGSGTTTGSGTTAGSGSGGAPSATGPGITAKEVRIGIPYCNDCATANGAIGAGGQDPGDTRRYYQAAIDDVNSRGGVLGRKLMPVWHSVSASDNIDASSQAACEKFTTDTKVAAFALRGEIAAACGRKAGIMVLGAVGTGAAYARYPDLFAPGDIRLEGLYGTTVRAMVKAGWQKPSPPWATGKIGLVTWDNADYHYAMTNGYLKALHEAGLKETDVRYVSVPQNANAIADASAAISNAVLSFRQKGIDHVFIGDGQAGIFSGAGLTLLFLQNAKSQSYKPRYGFNSNNAPDFSSHPKDQLTGMLAIDSFDTAARNDAGMSLNPVRERCFSVMKKHGLPVGDDQTQTLAVNACEIAWFPAAVLNRAGDSALSRVVPAAESLGTTYRSPFTYGVKLGPGRHDGAYLFRNEMFDDGCQCIKYTSKPYEP